MGIILISSRLLIPLYAERHTWSKSRHNQNWDEVEKVWSSKARQIIRVMQLNPNSQNDVYIEKHFSFVWIHLRGEINSSIN